MSLTHKIRRQPLPSADAIAGNDDLLTEILICLPAKSLCRFKSVSKHWYSLISHPQFSLLRMPHSTSGFFLSMNTRSKTPLYSYVHLSGTPLKSAPFKSITFGDDPSRISIMHSCNGLFLLCFSHYWMARYYYIYNPTTKQFAIIPTPSDDNKPIVPAMNLAFDLSRAPHYRIVLVRYRLLNGTRTYQIEIYSSETRAWRISGGPFPLTNRLHCRKGVFFNGTIHWVSRRLDTRLRFDVDKECLETMPMPTTQDGKNVMFIKYFGESGGHLYVIASFSSTAFDVLEMESNYSNWFLKYRVDIEDVAATCPPFTAYSILHLVHGEVEEQSALVVRIGAMVISYNLKDKSIKKLCNLVQCGEWSHAHQYVETLFRI